MSEVSDPVLDVRQIKRIEAVHGGFLYQHLHAVATCSWQRSVAFHHLCQLSKLYWQLLVVSRKRQVLFDSVSRS